ncbi:glycosyltransferase [Salinibacter ruber]|uniref:glycosyltransferase n=1 Tax=Salinibacter ruber TaxID=146919 RepID=UPI003C6E6374
MKQEAQRLGCPDEKLTVVHLSREIDQFSFCPPTSEVSSVLFVERLTPKKAPLDAIKALRRANKRGAGLHLDMIGDGKCWEDVEQYVKEHDLSDAGTFHGHLSNEKVSACMQCRRPMPSCFLAKRFRAATKRVRRSFW